LSGRPINSCKWRGSGGAAVRWLHNESPLGPQLVEQLTQLKAALDAESDVAIVFGSDFRRRYQRLGWLWSKLHGKVRYMALGDYANSRGAADMGVLPTWPRLCEDFQVRLTVPQMIEARRTAS